MGDDIVKHVYTKIQCVFPNLIRGFGIFGRKYPNRKNLGTSVLTWMNLQENCVFLWINWKVYLTSIIIFYKKYKCKFSCTKLFIRMPQITIRCGWHDFKLKRLLPSPTQPSGPSYRKYGWIRAELTNKAERLMFSFTVLKPK